MYWNLLPVVKDGIDKLESSNKINFWDFQGHEEKLNEIDMIQSHLLSNDFKSQQDFELLKRSLNRSIQEESEKLVDFSPFEEMISGNIKVAKPQKLF